MENTPRIKGIIFDYGGTIDSRGVHWSEIIWDGYQAAGIGIDKAQFRDAYVYAERELARTRHILPHHNFLDLLRIKMRLELEWLAREEIMQPDTDGHLGEAVARYCYNAARECVEEARPVLEALCSRYPMVLVSNFYGNVEAVLTDFDLRRYFKAIIESAVVGVRKPDPAIFALGVDALGMKPGRCSWWATLCAKISSRPRVSDAGWHGSKAKAGPRRGCRHSPLGDQKAVGSARRSVLIH